jgi:hypothetical protein
MLKYDDSVTPNMVTLTDPQQIIGFVVFFFPGFISLLVGAQLLGSSIKNRSVIETIVLSYVFSAVLFYILSPVIGVDITSFSLGQMVLSPASWILIFGVSVILGVAIATSIGIWLHIVEFILKFADRVKNTLGFELITLSAVSEPLLRIIWNNRELNDIIVMTTSGEMFRGKLGAYSIEPRFEILLVRRSDAPIRKLEGNKWIELDEWGIWIEGKHIYRLHVIAKRL